MTQLTDDPQANHDLFLARVQETGLVWGLMGEDGWAACESGEYEGEVVASWDDFSQCVDDVKWFPGLQEVCAFTWLLRVESAWFRFIGCSSIPLKVT